jgi:hypothetical protein
MKGTSLSDKFPASQFQTLAQVLDGEGEVFQRHVLDLVQDVLGDKDMYHRTMDNLHQKHGKKEIDNFIKAAPSASGYSPKTAPVQELAQLASGVKDSHVVPSDIVLIVASELMHRRKWDQVMEANPGTLQTLKDRLKS